MPLHPQFRAFVTTTLLEDYPDIKAAVLGRLDFLCLSRFSSFDPEFTFSPSGHISGSISPQGT